jgi:ribosomal protein S12 methylthiotransferase
MPSEQAAAEGRGDVWLGRTAADAPDIDCVVYVTPRPDQPLAAGQIIPVEVVAASGYDLAGVPA